jgi:hypothetical protein
MKNINVLINKFDTVLKKYNPVNYQKMQPPLSKAQINEYLMSIKLFDVNIAALFEWKNGVDVSDGLDTTDQIFNFGILYPLEKVIDSFMNFPREISSFVPLIGDATGDFLLFDSRPGPGYGKIFLESASLLSIEVPYSYFDSIPAMIQTTIIAYEKRVFKYDDDEKWLEQDTDAFRKIAKKINTNCNYWSLK